MNDKIQLEVYSPFGIKQCELYNSSCESSGQATDITIKKTLREIYQLTFSLPFTMEDADGKIIDNYRWENIKNEYLVYYIKNDVTDVYRIKTPEDIISGKKMSNTVTCLHRQEVLKHRNLTQTYDVIALNARDHLAKALEGSGWGIDTVDNFYEESIYEKNFILLADYVPTPSDMSFGSYGEIINLSGESIWNGSEWQTANIKITSMGKNLFDGMVELGHIDSTTGEPVYQDNANRYRSINFVYTAPFISDKIVFSGSGFVSCDIFFYDSNKSLLSIIENITYCTVPANAVWMKFMLRFSSDGLTEFTTSPTNIQIELDSVTEYEKYMYPFVIDVGNLGIYDIVNRDTITRGTGYNNTDHAVYRLETPTYEKLSIPSFKLYPNGIVCLENSGVGDIACRIVYNVDSSEGASNKVMIRSSSKESGVSCYDNLYTIADLFSGNLRFNGYNKTVSLVKVIGERKDICFFIGKNMNSIRRTKSSDDYITRLHVINQTSESGYIGIEKVNPLGTSFLIDFSYFENANILSEAQVSAITTYKNTVTGITADYRIETDEYTTRSNNINNLVGVTQLAYAPVTLLSGSSITIGNKIVLSDCPDPVANDTIYIQTQYNTWYEYYVISYNTSTKTIVLSGTPTSCISAVWVKKDPAGLLGARLIEIDTKRTLINELWIQYDDADTDEERNEISTEINGLEDDIETLYSGTSEFLGLRSLFSSLIIEMTSFEACKAQIAILDGQYADANSAFESVMGDTISDGIFPQGNYADGQELTLYADALRYLHDAAQPQVEYVVEAVELSKLDDYKIEEVKFGDIVYITEDKLGISNLEVTVTTFTETPISNKLNTFNVGNYNKKSNEWMQDVFTAAQKIKAKSKIYDRASSIDPNGLINSNVLSNTFAANNIGETLDISNNESITSRVTYDELDNIIGITVNVVSSNGIILSDMTPSTIISAKIYKGSEDVTSKIPASKFYWRRISLDTMADEIWNEAHAGIKKFVATQEDVVKQATYELDITD